LLYRAGEASGLSGGAEIASELGSLGTPAAAPGRGAQAPCYADTDALVKRGLMVVRTDAVADPEVVAPGDKPLGEEPPGVAAAGCGRSQALATDGRSMEAAGIEPASADAPGRASTSVVRR